MTEYIERIKYNCSKNRPISRRSLLYLIPEVYNEKIDDDLKCDAEGKRRRQFDEFFYLFMKDKFKLEKITKKHCEESLMAIIEYSKEDNRVDLLRRFLGIGEDKLRREILDIFLSLIRSKLKFLNRFGNFLL